MWKERFIFWYFGCSYLNCYFSISLRESLRERTLETSSCRAKCHSANKTQREARPERREGSDRQFSHLGLLCRLLGLLLLFLFFLFRLRLSEFCFWSHSSPRVGNSKGGYFFESSMALASGAVSQAELLLRKQLRSKWCKDEERRAEREARLREWVCVIRKVPNLGFSFSSWCLSFSLSLLTLEPLPQKSWLIGKVRTPLVLLCSQQEEVWKTGCCFTFVCFCSNLNSFLPLLLFLCVPCSHQISWKTQWMAFQLVWRMRTTSTSGASLSSVLQKRSTKEGSSPPY